MGVEYQSPWVMTLFFEVEFFLPLFMLFYEVMLVTPTVMPMETKIVSSKLFTWKRRVDVSREENELEKRWSSGVTWS